MTGSYQLVGVSYDDSLTAKFDKTCYDGSGLVGSQHLEVMCTAPIVTSYVKVSLGGGISNLALCEIEIYGGKFII